MANLTEPSQREVELPALITRELCYTVYSLSLYFQDHNSNGRSALRGSYMTVMFARYVFVRNRSTCGLFVGNVATHSSVSDSSTEMLTSWRLMDLYLVRFC